MEIKEETRKKLNLSVITIKEAYEKAFKDNPAALKDLRTFCNLDIPTNMSNQAGSLDATKVLIKTGRASVFSRIEYWLNTPVEEIQKDELNKWEQRA